MMKFNIGKTLAGKEFTLPADLVTQTQAIVATKGKGKTYLAMVQTEEMLKADAQVVCLDPTGVWWGLQADGIGKGFPIIVMGGEHGNVPLEPTAGEIVADFIVDSDQSAVLDLSAFESGAAQDRFVTAFAERLYRRKANKRTPVHLMIDEADSFAPQRPMPGQQRMLGAWEAIVRRGRSRGIGITLITQRPAVLNKNVLSQAELLTCLGVVGVHDQKAIDEWVKLYGTEDKRVLFMSELAKLPKGRAWFWSPAWLDCFTQVNVRKKLTFDSSRTPEAGSLSEKPKHLAKPDIAKLTQQIQATIEKAKADDPRELRRKIAELQASLNRSQVKVAPCNHLEEIERLKAENKLYAKALAKLNGFKTAIKKNAELVQQSLDRLQKSVDDDLADYFISESERIRSDAVKREIRTEPRTVTREVQPRVIAIREPKEPVEMENGFKPGKVHLELLNIISALERIGISNPSRAMVAAHAGKSKAGGYFMDSVSRLKTAGLIDYPQQGVLTLTDAGRSISDADAYIVDSGSMIERWYAIVGNSKAKLLRIIVEKYPGTVTREEVGQLAGEAHDGGYFMDRISRLKTLGLIEYPTKRFLKAADVLFPS